jgi:hypothetical protein
MATRRSFLAALLASASGGAQEQQHEPWTIYITNDSCSDFTWNNTAEDTLLAYAEIIRSHLDEMTLTDGELPENRDHYNLSITGEAISFFNRYPERKDEFIRRVKEGRISISPFLNNSLFAFQSTESAIRNFYPAVRMQREWGLPLDIAEHIECPSMPWGMAPLLAACGVRWLTVPFLDYDSSFKHLEIPPLFIWEAPDGSTIRMAFDKFASLAGSYSQGAFLLNDPSKIESSWVPHYESLGDAYPLRFSLASGTHNDLYLKSTRQTRPFAEGIRAWNAKAGDRVKLVNATLPQFCQAVDAAQQRRPFLKRVRGCFGHSWDLWPLTTAKYASGMRTEGSRLLDVEALATVASLAEPKIIDEVRNAIRKGEWAWTMLADHAWNGQDEANRKGNSTIRRNWLADLERSNDTVANTVWQALELVPQPDAVTVFHPVTFEQTALARIPVDFQGQGVQHGSAVAPSQTVEEDGLQTTYFALQKLRGHELSTFSIVKNAGASNQALQGSDTSLKGPFYRLRVDARTGGLASVIHVGSGQELLTPGSTRTLGQMVYHDGQEHPLRNFTSKLVTAGPVLARLAISGTTSDIRHETFVTIYADVDRVDFDVRIEKPVTTREQRLCHVFPVVPANAVLRADTTGVVIRPYPQPKGDLLPGADTGRFAVQGFVDASVEGGLGVTIVPVEAFALRLDLDTLGFEVLGNDQNYQESTRDQNGENQFRFRYSLQAHTGGWRGAAAAAFSSSVTSPLMVVAGGISLKVRELKVPKVEADRALVTAFKPADDPKTGGHILRLWERAGKSGNLNIAVPGYKRAVQTDLLERDGAELPITNGQVAIKLAAHGFGCVRLFPA